MKNVLSKYAWLAALSLGAACKAHHPIIFKSTVTPLPTQARDDFAWRKARR